jgi:very-short-patch-repair endonuclease
VELLEVESDELAFFYHPLPGVGSVIVFYETVPGGAGYLRALAGRLSELGAISMRRLFDHDCSGACYRCLKNYRNQPFHTLLNKNVVRDVLFQFSSHELLNPPYKGNLNDAISLSNAWLQDHLDLTRRPPVKDTVIEQRLFGAIRGRGRLPLPVKQREFRDGEKLLTIADFAYENERIAIYCDGFAYHGTAEKLSWDAYKRNHLQADGWLVLTFWGQTIIRNPERCEEQIWRAFNYRTHNC